MTRSPESDMPRTVGRKKLWPERIQAKFAKGTLARIAAVLKDGETRLDFIREWVERGLQSREKPRK
jgi:hypothetical protein